MPERPRLLAIEDEPDQVRLLQVRLEANGFTVLFARDGEEGLKRAAEEKPGLILLDLMLPKLDGLEVARRLKGSPETKAIPILLLTAASMENLEEQATAAGAQGCLRRPYDSADLLAAIRKLLPP